MPIRRFGILVVIIVSASATSAVAPDQPASMYATPGVTVDGHSVISGEILPGQTIEIPPNNNVILRPGDDQVYVNPETTARYVNRQEIELHKGTTSVNTKDGVRLVVHQYTVTPKTVSQYEVSWTSERRLVRVYQGEVTVDGCGKHLDVMKDQVAELGRECKVGAYLWKPDNKLQWLGLAAPAGPVICWYAHCWDLSCDGSR